MSKLQELVKDREVWSVVVHGLAESDKTERLNKNKIHLACYQKSLQSSRGKKHPDNK